MTTQHRKAPSSSPEEESDTSKALAAAEGFLKGVNVHAPEARDYAPELITYLKNTPIEWVRIHPLPSRRLLEKNSEGVSYLEAIGKFAEAGFHLILPIDVGVKENVGVVVASSLRRFVDDSYSESFKAVKLIELRVQKASSRTKIIYGVENEIDTKEWIMQAMPTVGWRGTALAWFTLSVDVDLKYKRLENILQGIKEAAPSRPTMVNFECDDPRDDWSSLMSFILGAQTVLSKLHLLERDARVRMNNYRVDVAKAVRRLPVELLGVDHYPNYFSKFPPKGEEIGHKVDELARKTRMPVINVEFGYTAHEPARNRLFRRLFHARDRAPLPALPPEEYQRLFFQSALGSIESSASQGTFPWVLFLDPGRHYRPVEENGFSLLHYSPQQKEKWIAKPAMEYYLHWLEARIDGSRPQESEWELPQPLSERTKKKKTSLGNSPE